MMIPQAPEHRGYLVVTTKINLVGLNRESAVRAERLEYPGKIFVVDSAKIPLHQVFQFPRVQNFCHLRITRRLKILQVRRQLQQCFSTTVWNDCTVVLLQKRAQARGRTLGLEPCWNLGWSLLSEENMGNWEDISCLENCAMRL